MLGHVKGGAGDPDLYNNVHGSVQRSAFSLH